MIEVALVPICAVLNRVRGGGLGGALLPGHPRLWVAPAIGVASLLVGSPLQAVLVAACYLFWAWLPWGRWYDLGRLPPPDRAPSWFERRLEELPNDHARFAARNFAACLPAAVLVSPLFLLLPLAQAGAYELGWVWWETDGISPIPVAELVTGAAWGVLIISMRIMP